MKYVSPSQRRATERRNFHIALWLIVTAPVFGALLALACR